MKTKRSIVVSTRLPVESGKRLKRMASRHGWTPSDTSARLIEEGLRRAEFAFIDFRDSVAGRHACIGGSSLGVWECSRCWYALTKGTWWRWRDICGGRRGKVRAAVHYAEAFPEEIEQLMSENESVSLATLKRMVPQAAEFVARKSGKR